MKTTMTNPDEPLFNADEAPTPKMIARSGLATKIEPLSLLPDTRTPEQIRDDRERISPTPRYDEPIPAKPRYDEPVGPTRDNRTRRPRARWIRSRSVELTQTEREVLKLIATGLTRSEIARILGIGCSTYDSHRGSALGKLNIRTPVEIWRWAIRKGLINEPIIQEIAEWIESLPSMVGPCSVAYRMRAGEWIKSNQKENDYDNFQNSRCQAK